MDRAWEALVGRSVTVRLADGASATGGLRYVDARPGGYVELVSLYTNAVFRIEEADITALEEQH